MLAIDDYVLDLALDKIKCVVVVSNIIRRMDVIIRTRHGAKWIIDIAVGLDERPNGITRYIGGSREELSS